MSLEHKTDVQGNSQVIKRPLVINVSDDLTLSKEHSGATLLLDAATGATITLPALDYDLKFKFVVGAAFATDNWVVASAEGDNINGGIADMGTTVAAVIASGEDQINFVASAETIGDWVEIWSDYDNSQWIVNGVCFANGGITATDPA